VTSAECDLRMLVQRPIGIHSAKALNVESMRFTAFPLTRCGGGGDSILAAVQILTWRFFLQNMAAVERAIIILKTIGPTRTEQWREDRGLECPQGVTELVSLCGQIAKIRR
jgi:hypothetical protein